MNQKQKNKAALKKYQNASNKKDFCIGLSEELKEKGFGEKHWFSIQSNEFSREKMPRIEAITNIYYDYAKNYTGKTDSNAGKSEKHSTVDA